MKRSALLILALALLVGVVLVARPHGSQPDASLSAASATPTASDSLMPSPTPTPTQTAQASPEPQLPPAPAPDQMALASGPRAPAIGRVPTTQRVVFITIDDGYVTDPRVLDLIRSKHIPVSAFLLPSTASSHLEYFRELQDAGGTIEDHTINHKNLPNFGYDAQRWEICHPLPAYQSMFGHRPRLFRPPYGAYNQTTRAAAASCGVAIIMWRATMNNGYIAFQDGVMLPGDIILMHWRSDLYQNLTNLLQFLAERKYSVGRLESYLQVAPPQAPTPTKSPRPTASPSPSRSPSPSPSPSKSPSPSPSPSQSPSSSPSPSPSGSPSPSPSPSQSPSGAASSTSMATAVFRRPSIST